MKEELIKQFIKEMSNKLGDINEEVVLQDKPDMQKGARSRWIKGHLVQAYNLLVQLEEGMKEEPACKINMPPPRIDWQAVRRG